MLLELTLVGGVIVAVIGVLELSARLDGAPRLGLRPESLLREAMRGPEGGAVRAEFRQSGICPPERPQIAGFR